MKKLVIVAMTILLTGCFEQFAAPAPAPTPKAPASWGDETHPEKAGKWDNVKWQ